MHLAGCHASSRAPAFESRLAPAVTEPVGTSPPAPPVRTFVFDRANAVTTLASHVEVAISLASSHMGANARVVVLAIDARVWLTSEISQPPP